MTTHSDLLRGPECKCRRGFQSRISRCTAKSLGLFITQIDYFMLPLTLLLLNEMAFPNPNGPFVTLVGLESNIS